MLVTLVITVTQLPDRGNPREERLLLAHRYGQSWLGNTKGKTPGRSRSVKQVHGEKQETKPDLKQGLDFTKGSVSSTNSTTSQESNVLTHEPVGSFQTPTVTGSLGQS